MGRKTQFPPVPRQHRTAREKAQGKPGRARVKVHGEWVSLGPWQSPEAEAKLVEVINRLAAERGVAAPAPPPMPRTLDRPTVLDVVLWFRREKFSEYAEDSREPTLFEVAFRPLLRLFGNDPADEFDREKLEQLQAAMASGSWMTGEEKEEYRARKRPVGWCRNVVNRQVVRIRTVWRAAEGKKVNGRPLVPPGSYEHLRSLPGVTEQSRKVRHTEPVLPSKREDLEKVLPYCTRPVRAMLDLQWWSGMRSGEVRIMRTVDVNQKGPVVDGVQTWTYRPGSDRPFGRHKNAWRKQHRVITLGLECQRILAPLLKPDRPEEYLFRPCDAVEDRNEARKAQSGRKGKRPRKRKPKRKPGECYSANSYAHAVARACRDAGVKLTGYQGRHAAKDRVTAAEGLDAARAMLGQKSITSTADYGAAVDLQTAARAAARHG